MLQDQTMYSDRVRLVDQTICGATQFWKKLDVSVYILAMQITTLVDTDH